MEGDRYIVVLDGKDNSKDDSKLLEDDFNKIINIPEGGVSFNGESFKKETPTPEVLARKAIANTTPEGINALLAGLGVSPEMMRKQAMEDKRKKLGIGQKGSITKKCIIMKASGSIKSADIAIGTEYNNTANLIKVGTPIEKTCSRLSIGNFSQVKIWYNPEHKGKNKRLSKIFGFNVGGEALIATEDEDLTMEAFLAAEKLLQ